MVSPRQLRDCRVEHGPRDADAAGFAGEAADNLCAAADFAEGAFDEVGVSDAVMMLGREPTTRNAYTAGVRLSSS
jgi:hypothetical protein